MFMHLFCCSHFALSCLNSFSLPFRERLFFNLHYPCISCSEFSGEVVNEAKRDRWVCDVFVCLHVYTDTTILKLIELQHYVCRQREIFLRRGFKPSAICVTREFHTSGLN
jgi:hypothetical protein